MKERKIDPRNRRTKMRIAHSAFVVSVMVVPLVSWVHHAVAGWQKLTSGTNINLRDITAHHGNFNLVWAVGEGGLVLHSSNGGTTWEPQESEATGTLHSVAFLEGPGAVMAVGENGTILRTVDLGLTWLAMPSGTTLTLRAISEFATMGGFTVVGDSGIILRSSDGGITWQRVGSPTTARLNAVAMGFAGSICGDSGVVLRKLTVGGIWEAANSGTTENLYGIPMFSSSDLIVGGGGLVLRSTSHGQSWFPQETPTASALRAVEFSSANAENIYAVGDNGTILKTTNGGINWGLQESLTSQNLHGVFFYLNNNVGWAAGDSGTILKTTDGGGPMTGTTMNDPEIPGVPSLLQNYPNPFNPTTRIRVQVAVSGMVSLRIFDITGREVATLLNEIKEPGTYEVSWDGSMCASGTYFSRLLTERIMLTRKLLLVR
jgi:photosystem II stability/assembly factor-like uncharacterized protein